MPSQHTARLGKRPPSPRHETMTKTPPFLKWAGGKRWLAETFCELQLPAYSRYIEPFLGSGAVFFNIRPAQSVLSDLNHALINTYRAIRDDWASVVFGLEAHQARHSRAYYYRVRSSQPTDKFERAARFIYLNRTCWNGLFRVNSNGQFNVPIGTKSQVVLATDNFKDIAALLANARLHAGDFMWAIDQARGGDLVYVDPPYTINHDKNGFLKYNQRLFAWEDQVRLHKALLAARRKGAFIIVSNAHHKSIRDLYRQTFRVITLRRFSRISGTNAGRSAGLEYLFIGGPI